MGDPLALDESRTPVDEDVLHWVTTSERGVEWDAACDVIADADALSATVFDRTLSGDLPADFTVVAYALAATAGCGGAVADVVLRASVRENDR